MAEEWSSLEQEQAFSPPSRKGGGGERASEGKGTKKRVKTQGRGAGATRPGRDLYLKLTTAMGAMSEPRGALLFGGAVLVAEVPPPRSVGLLPAPRHRISPSWGQHIWPGLQAVWRQEMLLWMEQVQSREHVLSVYHFSPTCRERVSAEPIEAWKLERDGGLPPPDTPHPRTPKRSASFGHPPPSPAFLKLQASEFCSSAPSTAPPHFFARPKPSGTQLMEAPLQSGFSPGGRRPQGWCSHTRRGAHSWSRSGCGLSDTRSPRRRATRKGSTMECSG